ncbi:MAG: hypothetical protein FJW51_01895 [Actinobacteria bacterium]|nr:hypothetical protein [Actinomycetota bacterium]
MNLTKRGITGIVLIVVSIMAAGLIARSTDKTSLYWVATGEIATGDRISDEQVALARLFLPGHSEYYLSATEDVIGMIAREAISQGEALNRGDLSENSDFRLWRLISLDISSADLPYSAVKGSLIDIYRLLEDGSLGAELVLESVVVDSVSIGNVISDRVQVVVRLPLAQVRPLLDAYATSRITISSHLN